MKIHTKKFQIIFLFLEWILYEKLRRTLLGKNRLIMARYPIFKPQGMLKNRIADCRHDVCVESA